MELVLDLKKRYTYTDYLTWVDDIRRELIDGFIHLMTPAPTSTHQRICINLSAEFHLFLKKKKCKVFTAPFDVRFPVQDHATNKDQIYTVLQPDICVICDPTKIDAKGCNGAPDLIVEIVSPTSAKTDVEDKFKIYEKTGVKEYWIVYPGENSISVFNLNHNGQYQLTGMYANDSKIEVTTLPGLVIDLAEIFEE